MYLNVPSKPFPMNPSFTPPPPLSDELRQQIYEDYMKDPIKNSVRSLSQRHHLSLKRVDSILRLKGLEYSWYKVCTCFFSIQTQNDESNKNFD